MLMVLGDAVVLNAPISLSQKRSNGGCMKVSRPVEIIPLAAENV